MQTKILNWSTNTTAYGRHPQQVQVTQGTTVLLQSLDNPEMFSRAQYVKRAACKLHRDKQLLHISISTRRGHLMPMFGLWLVTSDF